LKGDGCLAGITSSSDGASKGHSLSVYFDGVKQTITPGSAYEFEGHQIFVDVK